MNSAKWEAETWLGRKPKVPVEIIDEGDEYLDGLTYRTSVTRRLYERIRREGLVDDDTLRLSLEHFQDTLDRYGQEGYDGFLQEEERIAGFLADFIDMLEGAEPSDFVLGIKTRIRLILENQEGSWARTNRDPPQPGDNRLPAESRRDPQGARKAQREDGVHVGHHPRAGQPHGHLQDGRPHGGRG